MRERERESDNIQTDRETDIYFAKPLINHRGHENGHFHIPLKSQKKFGLLYFLYSIVPIAYLRKYVIVYMYRSLTNIFREMLFKPCCRDSNSNGYFRFEFHQHH